MLLRILPLLTLSASLASAAAGGQFYLKERLSVFTPEKIAHARANIERYPWAGQIRDRAVARAERHLALGLDYWWGIVPPPTLPRSSSIGPGSPITGTEFNRRFRSLDYELNPEGQTWKLKDPSSGYLFPTNDFAAYYATGLDRHGIFQPDRADRSLLKNTLYPEKGETWGVDDGFGWIDDEGQRWTFIAFYTHWNYRGFLEDAVTDLRDAYLYTGDPRYGRVGAVILDRLADLYPSMELWPYTQMGYSNSHGGSGDGKVVGCIWETGPLKTYNLSYDALFPIFEDPELIAFLAEKARRFELPNAKSNAAIIRKNIEEGLLLETYKAVRTARVRGNFGSHQSTLAAAAVVLDHPRWTPEMLDFVFRSGGFLSRNHPEGPVITGGDVARTLVDVIDRDGMGNEASPRYNRIWLVGMSDLAEMLEGYDRYPGDLYQHVKFKQMFYPHASLLELGSYTPQIGDTQPAVGTPSPVLLEAERYVKAFQKWGDPLHAQLAYFVNGNTAKGLHGDIFSADADAEARITAAIDQHGPWKPESAMLNGYGYASLRAGAGENARALWLYHGRNFRAHPQSDTLNLGIYAYGFDLAPEIGYPTSASSNPERNFYIDSPISHNTVMVDKAHQDENWTGEPHFFFDGSRVKAFEISAPRAYRHTRLYRRSSALIAIDERDSYIVDFFRIAGGRDHHFSFHGPDSRQVTTSGLELGPAAPVYRRDIDPETAGFQYLANARRDSAPPPQFSVDWEVNDFYRLRPDATPIHLRLTLLTQAQEVALADGHVPDKPNVPDTLPFLLVHRQGENLSSLFTSVIEPYRGNSRIRSIQPATLTIPGAADAASLIAADHASAVRVELDDGRVDFVVSSLNPQRRYQVDGKHAFQGSFGVLSERSGRAEYACLVGGKAFGPLRQDQPELTGQVIDFTRELSFDNALLVSLDQLPPSSEWLIGQRVAVENDGERNAVYTILKVRPEPEGRLRLGLGEKTLIRGYLDPNEFNRGFRFNLEPGARLRIPIAGEADFPR